MPSFTDNEQRDGQWIDPHFHLNIIVIDPSNELIEEK